MLQQHMPAARRAARQFRPAEKPRPLVQKSDFRRGEGRGGRTNARFQPLQQLVSKHKSQLRTDSVHPAVDGTKPPVRLRHPSSNLHLE